MTPTITPGTDRQAGEPILRLVDEIAETSRDTTEQGTRFENLMLQVLPDIDLAELTGHEVTPDSWHRWRDWPKRHQYGEAAVGHRRRPRGAARRRDRPLRRSSSASATQA